MTPRSLLHSMLKITFGVVLALTAALPHTAAAAVAPTVLTSSPGIYTLDSAVLGGKVKSDGGAPVTDRGIVWATSANPTTANTKVANGSGTGFFSATVTGFTAATLVHVRAYAINSVGTSYGSDLTFTTTQDLVPTANVGQFNSQAIVSGNPAVAFYDAGGKNLHYIRATAADGSAWGTNYVADNPGTAGGWVSLAIISGRPAMAYNRHTSSTSGLQYMRAADATGDTGTSWTVGEVFVNVDHASGDTGQYNSLTTVNGNPAISYCDSTGVTQKLMYVRATSTDGSTWGTPLLLDSSSALTGLYTTLVIANGNPAISYYDATNGNLKYVRATDASGTAWGAAPVTVASTGDVGSYASMVIANGNPAIAYYDLTNGYLKYVRATDTSGTTWGTPVVLDNTANVGQGISMAIITGYPAIAYYDVTNGNLKYVQATDANGTTWGALATWDSTGNKGMSPSLAALASGAPGVAYENFTSGTVSSVDYTMGFLPPTVTAISPTSGSTAGGTPVTITGTGFIGTTNVTIGGVAATSIVEVSETSITAITPAGSAGTASVVVTARGGTNTANTLYTYVVTPVVTGISPTFGTTAGGTSVTITGTGFTGATSVTIGGTAATSVTYVSDTSITATTPAGTVGTASVVVTAPSGSNSPNTLYTYISPPSVTGISPSSGTIAGGTSINITGSGFTGTTGVTIGGVAATGVTVVDDNTITATTPAGSLGAADVVVTNPLGSGTGTGIYTYSGIPTVTAISPTVGSTAGGTSVTITGTNFTGTTAVTLGGVAATGFTVVSDTSITATTGAHVAGVVNVAVTNPSGTGTGTGLYGYYDTPTVSGISPNGGPIAGGTSVTLTGTGFTGTTGITIGGVAATGVTVVNDTTITATTGAHAAGLVNVAVTNPAGTGTGTGLYTYYNTPTVSGIAPTGGSTAGGTSVTLTGTNFTGATGATVGGVALTSFTVVNDTTITGTTGAHAAGLVNVAVTNPGGTGTGTGLFTYFATPTVSGIAPTGGPIAGGTSVTLTGTNFTGATGMTVGGVAVTSFTVVNDTTITGTTGAHAAGLVDVAVTNPGGTGTGTGLFTYYNTPTVSGISPTGGSTAGGTSVTLTGTNFTGATGATVGGVALTSFTVVNDTTITGTTAAHAAGLVNVAVTNPGGTGTGTGLFTYFATPTVSGISPTGGSTAGGTSVTLTGTNFTGATGMTVGGVAVTSFTVVNDTTITGTTGAHAAGLVDVAVTNPGGTGTGTGLFTYFATPTVSGIAPTGGPVAGGTSVTLTGTNFTGATGMTVGGVAVTSFTVVNDTTITGTTGAHAAGLVDVAVTNPGGTGTGTGLFTYYNTPTVSGISPTGGSTAGGTSVTLTGTNFTGATGAAVGGVALTGFTVVNDTTITGTTGAHAAGLVNVAVTNPGGTGTGTGLFTYYNTPSVSGIAPTGGPIAGGTSVTLTGTNFTGATGMTVGGVAVTSFTVVNDTTITGTTGAHAAGLVNVAVTNPGGTGTGTGLYTYYNTPTVSGISPTSGPIAGGTSVTLTGTNFTGATGMTVGGVALTGFTVVNDTTITGTTGAHAAGLVDVAVTNPGGTGTGTGLYTYITTPTVTTPTSASITATTATLGGNVTSDGSATVTARGVVYSVTATNSSPQIAGTGVTNATTGGTTGVFTVGVTGLTPGTAYSFAAYATNSQGTSYSSVGTFTSLSNNDNLSALTTSPGTLVPVFASGTTSYSVIVPGATTSMTVTPTVADATATVQVQVNGGGYATVTSGSPSGPLALNPGSNTVDVKVTAQDGTFKIYTITVTRGIPIVWVDPSFTTPGTVIADADPVTPGAQPAVVGVTAFSTISAAVAAVDPSGTVEVNANTYTESVNTGAKAITLVSGVGTGAVVINGSLTLNSSDTLQVAINGTVVGTSYGQWQVSGTVTLGGATLTLTGSEAPVVGQVFDVVHNTGGSAISGTFSGEAEGAVISSFLGSSLPAEISYLGGTGHDVTLTVMGTTVTPGGQLVISNPPGAGGNSDLTITLVGTNIQIYDPNNLIYAGAGATQVDPNTITIPLASVTTGLVFNGTTGNDSFTVDFSTGNPIPPGGMVINGGAGSDAVRFVGTGLHAVYTPDAVINGNGVVVFTGVNAGTVTFTGMERVDLDLPTGSFALSPPSATNVVDLANGFLLNGTTPALAVSGTSGSVGFAPAYVRGATVTIDTSAIAGSTDTITLASANNLHTDTSLTINTGTNASDSIAVNGPVVFAGPVSLNATTVTVTAAGSVTTTGAGTLTIGADALTVDPAATLSSAVSVSLKQNSNGTLIDLGGANAAGTLGLSDAELDVVSTPTLNIGDVNSGAITVSASITRPSSTAMNLTSGATIGLNHLLDSAGGNVTLKGTTITPAATGTDVSMGATGTLAFGSGDNLAIAIGGATADSGYTQLNVVGHVNLTGAVLALSGAYVPAPTDTFTLVNNDGVDAVTGTFTGLAQGATFVFNGKILGIHYDAGDGNDVVLSVAPVLNSVTPPANATYNNTDVMTFTVDYSKAVIVNTAGGTPYIGVNIGGTVRHAVYVSGSGTTDLVFQYTVTSVDLDSDGVVMISPIMLSGGTIKDSSGNDAPLVFTPPVTTSVLVDGRIVSTAGAAPDTAPGTTVGGSSVGTWDSIRSGMVIASSGALAFRAHLVQTGGVDATNNQGIWKSPDGSYASTYLLARTGNPLTSTGSVAPDTGGAWFVDLPLNPYIDNLGQNTFVGFLDVGSGTPVTDSTTDSGIWSEQATAGAGARLLVRQGDAVTGGTVTMVAPSGWAAVSQPATTSADGYTAFNVQLNGNTVTPSSALLRVKSTSTPTPLVTVSTLALEGDGAPNIGGGTLGTFAAMYGNSNDPRMDGAGDVAFLAYMVDGSSGIFYDDVATSTLSAVARSGGATPTGPADTFSGFERPSLAGNGGQIAFRAFLASGGQSVWKGDPAAPGGLVAIAKTGDAGLTGIPAGSTLNSVWSPFSNASGKVAFRVSMLDALSSESRAIVTDTNGTLSVIASVTNPLNNKANDANGVATAETFTNFDHPIIGDNNQVAFSATTATITGIWKQAPGGGTLSLKLKVGDKITSNSVTRFVDSFIVVGTASSDRLSEVTAMNAAGQILVWIKYTNGDTGMLLTVP